MPIGDGAASQIARVPRTSPAKRSKPAALDSLSPGERGQVLDALITERPELSTEAERIAVELLGSVSIDHAASDVEAALCSRRD